MTRPDFATPITTIEAAKAFIEALHAADLMFHFEDSPETIINGSGDEIFTKDEMPLVRQRIADLYEMDWTTVGHECPIGYALQVMDGEPPTLAGMTEEYDSHLAVGVLKNLPKAAAEELILDTSLTERQRSWLSTFMRRWEAVEKMEAA